MARIPFTVIGGFLGAGKTTLLQRWLTAAQGRRIAVLVNDFGAVNLDAALIAQRGADTIALSNGCVCCSIGDDLSAALTRVLQASPPFDAVVVEASGVADPWRIAQYGLADPQLALDGVVVMVDAAAIAAQAADPLLADTLQRPLAHADLVVLNKADLAGPQALAAARAWVSKHADAVPVVAAVQADVPLQLLGVHAARGGWPAAPAAHSAVFETWDCRDDAAHDALALRQWLRALPPGVLRLKGVLRSADGWVELQYAGRHGSLRRAETPPVDGAALVAIGLRGQLPTAALAAGLKKARLHSTTSP